MNWKLAVDVLLVLVLFAFGPRENREFLFRSEPDLLYGELVVFVNGDRSLSLARNAAAGVAHFTEPRPQQMWWRNLSTGNAAQEVKPEKIYADTFAIVERTPTSSGNAQLVHFGDAPPQQPRRLRVVTEGEEFHDFLWVCIIVALGALLSFAICDYSWRCGSPLRDILGEAETPS